MTDFGILNDLDEEEVESFRPTYRRDALLYVIEVSESMLKKDSAGYSNLYRALYAAYQSMKARNTGSYLDYTGIMVYGTEKFDKQAFVSCHVLSELHQPRIDDLRRIRDMLDDEQLFNSALVPSSSENRPSVGSVMEYASMLFNERTTGSTSKRILWITDNANPHPNEPNELRLAKTRSEDLVDYDIQLNPLLIASSSADNSFDWSIFWKHLAYGRYTNVNKDDMSSVIVNSDQLASYIEKKRAVTRATYTVTVELGDKIKFGAKGYLMIHKAKLPSTHRIYANDERKVFAQSKTSLQVGTTAKEIDGKDVVKAFPVLDDYVIFTPEELSNIKSFEKAPVIRILGFKPMHAIEPWQNMTHPVFFYPDDTKYDNSTRAFACLHQVLLETKQVAIAWTLLQNASSPRLAALFPIPPPDSELYKNGLDIRQCGFQLVVLPFAEEVRQDPQELASEPPKVSEAAIQKAREIHQSLLLEGGYFPSKYHNFLLQSFYNFLEAYALGEEHVETPEDVKIPVAQIDKRCGDLIEQFHELA